MPHLVIEDRGVVIEDRRAVIEDRGAVIVDRGDQTEVSETIGLVPI
jgi:hypothetical protein